jgi:hypothetical protein
MAKVSYTVYSFRRPPLMDRALFESLKALPVKAGRLRYHPYEGFFRTFPIWSILFAAAAIGSLVSYLQGDKEWGLWLLVFLGLSIFTGGLFSMLSWTAYYADCYSYFREYSEDLNTAQDYEDFCRLRRGKHG